ncbi:MAG: hypothetical protein JW787_09105 [Sedimentisphaerales bacterium]|nr:hypothetical protein [Sedimentisphaerales bacterium]
METQIFRVYHYTSDYPGLKGKELKSKNNYAQYSLLTSDSKLHYDNIMPRIVVPDYTHHITHRGNNTQAAILKV